MTDTSTLPKQPKTKQSLIEKITSLLELADVQSTKEVKDAVDNLLKTKVAKQKEKLQSEINDLDKIETK